MHLPAYNILDWKVDRLPGRELAALQGERLAAMARYVYAETPFWKRKFDEAGISPEDINGLDDLPRLPFCEKAELQADQEEHPPFGSYVATPRSHWRKMTATSGTTGKPLKRVFSARDWGYLLDRFQRNPIVGPGDIAMILGPTDGLIGPTVSSATSERCGALVVHAGRYDTATRLKMIADLKPKIVSGTASYLLHLIEVAPDHGIDLTAVGVERLQSVGEPGAAVEATRDRLTAGWGARVSDGFGLTEIFPLGGSCPHSTDLHIASDVALVEVVDPETGKAVDKGEVGELVVTNLIGDTQPLLRYRTKDLVRVATDEACTCGFTGTRLAGGILGRIDDMIWFRGANIYPSAIEGTVRKFEAVSSEFQIVLAGSGSLPTMTVRIEPAFEGGVISEELLGRIKQDLASAIRVNANVEVVPFGSLPRVDAKDKGRRVVDRRQNFQS